MYNNVDHVLRYDQAKLRVCFLKDGKLEPKHERPSEVRMWVFTVHAGCQIAKNACAASVENGFTNAVKKIPEAVFNQ